MITKEAKAAYDRERRNANKEKDRARQKAWRDANKDKVAARQRRRYEASPYDVITRARNRELAESQRTPKWADVEAMKAIYRDAAEFRAAGLDVHVDHVIPLRGELVSGLHVHQNLTIKLASWNINKGNRYTP